MPERLHWFKREPRTPSTNENITSETIVNPNITKYQLKKLLKRFKIPIEIWGTERFKTIKDLLKEVKDRESRLVIKTNLKDGKLDNELIREVNKIRIRILDYDYESMKWYELFQVFTEKPDGTPIDDEPETPGLFEKRKRTKKGELENIKRAYARGLREELPRFFETGKGTDFLNRIIELRDDVNSRQIEKRVSKRFPGLNTEYHFNQAAYVISPDQYEDFYLLEETNGVKSVFIWMGVEASSDTERFSRIFNPTHKKF